MYGGNISVTTLIKYVAVFTAAVILGSWFDKERKISRAKGLPWHTPWFSAPGILIIIILALLIAVRAYLRYYH
jgi:uncharacterized membrane protein YidH (DUF202 family)